MSNGQQLITLEPSAVAAPLAMPDTAALKARIAAIESIISDLFQKKIHYGEAFPGAGKDSLLQPGAEMVIAAFGMAPDPEIVETDEGGGHRSYLCTGPLLAAGIPVGTMSATCSTLESKYRYRNGGRVCPSCGKEGAIIKGKEEYGGGWLCYSKKQGCGVKFEDGDKAIEEQVTGRVENEDPADVYHTARMMAQKRWLVAIARRTFALSARFVDAEGYGSALFDWEDRGAELLKALPGNRGEKWAAVGRFTLEKFGKEQRSITNVQGAVVLDWLRGGAGNAVSADLRPPGQDVEPVEPPKPAAADAVQELAVGLATGREDPPVPRAAGGRKSWEKKLRQAGILEEATEDPKIGMPAGWTRETPARLQRFMDKR